MEPIEQEYLKLIGAKKNLYQYWKLLAVDNGTYAESEHIKTLAHYSQKFAEGDIKRLIIVMPPRHGKSTMMQYMLSWTLSKDPEKSVMLLSYNDDFASEQGAKCRAIFDHPQHKRIFPNQKFLKDRYGEFSIGKSDGSPNFMSGGAGTAITGRGADRIVIDDPIKDSVEAASSSRKLTLINWFREVVVTRLVPGGGICLCMTRWAYDDLAGFLMEEYPDEWTVVHMPAINEDGEALWPGRFPIEELEKIRKELGERSFSALYQGRPTPESGAMFNREWFDIMDRPPNDWVEKKRIRFWDLAASKKGDYCTGVMMRIFNNGHVFVEDVYNEQVTPFEAEQAIFRLAHEDKCPIGIEEEGGSASKILLDNYKRELMQYGVMTIKPKKGENKEIRAYPFATACENGMVHIKKATWNERFLKEFCEFPLGKHDDMVDSTSHAFNALANSRRRNRVCLV